MSKTIGQFDFTIVKMNKGDDLPFDPQVTLQLAGWGTQKGVPTISPTLMSEREIDEQIDFLKEDLDAVGKRAKAALRKAKEHTKVLVETKSSD